MLTQIVPAREATDVESGSIQDTFSKGGEFSEILPDGPLKPYAPSQPLRVPA